MDLTENFTSCNIEIAPARKMICSRPTPKNMAVLVSGKETYPGIFPLNIPGTDGFLSEESK